MTDPFELNPQSPSPLVFFFMSLTSNCENKGILSTKSSNVVIRLCSNSATKLEVRFSSTLLPESRFPSRRMIEMSPPGPAMTPITEQSEPLEPVDIPNVKTPKYRGVVADIGPRPRSEDPIASPSVQYSWPKACPDWWTCHDKKQRTATTSSQDDVLGKGNVEATIKQIGHGKGEQSKRSSVC